ncbi:MAG TPA: DUF4303 domain-containing protein [Lacunisphaera sp.]|nr:DUF4303 domain-containing protein [Lacunisphaera sp.]
MAYCLYTNDDVCSIGPVANRASALKARSGDELYNYYRFSADEWSDWEDYGAFLAVNAWISQHAKRKDYFECVAPKLLSICIDALAEQKAAGVFAANPDQQFLAVWVSDSSSSLVQESVARLNSPEIYRAFALEFADSE